MEPYAQLAAARLAIGAGSWAAPGPMGKLFGLDVDANPQASYLARLFGIRDIALGVGLMATEGESRRLWLKIGVVCDLADAAAAVIARREKVVPAWAAVPLTGTALAAAGMGIASLRAA